MNMERNTIVYLLVFGEETSALPAGPQWLHTALNCAQKQHKLECVTKGQTTEDIYHCSISTATHPMGLQNTYMTDALHILSIIPIAVACSATQRKFVKHFDSTEYL